MHQPHHRQQQYHMVSHVAQAAPTIHQTMTTTNQAPARQVVERRIVHVTQPARPIETPTRRYITFKNRRDLNEPGNQWANCDIITMEISPDEIERQIRRHDIPGEDLLTVLGNMGVMRNRHVSRQEEKLNQREPDPENWKWVLEGLGELKEKRARTPCVPFPSPQTHNANTASVTHSGPSLRACSGSTRRSSRGLSGSSRRSPSTMSRLMLWKPFPHQATPSMPSPRPPRSSSCLHPR